MNISLYKSLVNYSIDQANTKLGSIDVINQLKNFNSLMTGEMPLYLDSKSLVASESNWHEGFTLTPIVLNGNTGIAKQILQLNDNSFVVINTNSEILHYSKAFVLIGKLPFNYGVSVTKEYHQPGVCAVIGYSSLSGSVIVNGSYLLVPQSDTHVVQIYKWELGHWSYVTVVGNVGVPGNGNNSFDTPVSVSGFFDGTVNKAVFAVSCLGTAPNGTTSFIKKIEMTIGGSLTDRDIIVTPTAINTGHMTKGEASNVTTFKYLPDFRLFALSQGTNEYGVLDTNLTTVFPKAVPLNVLSGVIASLDYGDLVSLPTAFDTNGLLTVVGDSRGHIAILNPDFTGVTSYFGRAKTSFATNYPKEQGAVVNVLLTNDSVYFITGDASSATKVYKSNFPYLTPQVATYEVGGVLHELELGPVFGLPGIVTVSVDNSDAVPVEESCCERLVMGAVVKVIVTRDIQSVIGEDLPLPSGVIIVKL